MFFLAANNLVHVQLVIEPFAGPLTSKNSLAIHLTESALEPMSSKASKCVGDSLGESGSQKRGTCRRSCSYKFPGNNGQYRNHLRT